MKIAVVSISVIALIIVIVFIWGSLLPVEHETKISQNYSVPPESVFLKITNFKDYPKWRTGVTDIQIDGDQRFIETSGHGKIPYKIKVSDSPHRLVTEIDDVTLPFSGTWTFEVSPTSQGSILTITERGKVQNPLFRFMSKYIFSHEKTVTTYLADLAR